MFWIEKIIIKKFKTAFCHRKDYGNEYFEGNKCLMIKEIIQIVQEYNPATLLRANQKDIHKDLDLEKQKIQIEKEKIELEKQKIQIEKEKIELAKFCNSNTITNPKERGNTIIPTQSKKKKIELRDSITTIPYVSYDLSCNKIKVKVNKEVKNKIEQIKKFKKLFKKCPESFEWLTKHYPDIASLSFGYSLQGINIKDKKEISQKTYQKINYLVLIGQDFSNTYK